jgi:hypothetical protein
MRLWPRIRWHRREEGPSDADRALAVSEAQHQQAQAERAEMENLAAKLRRMREVNHLAESFRDAFGEGR